MLTYNTQLKRLILPEYGRNIQRMVDHCLTSEDRNERTKCAHSIVAAMYTLFPAIRHTEGYRQKLWDHLAIMSDFKLDVDFPVEVIHADSLESHPDKLPYTAENIHRRHYGKYLELMVDKAVEMEAGEEKDELIMLIANHMKKLMLAVNSDGVDDAKIFKDLREISHGAIIMNPEEHRLHEFQAAPQPSGKKKKKR